MAPVLLTACSGSGEEDNRMPNVGNLYINFAISVSNGNQPSMRGTPTGGENGDGREVGFSRENAISGITLILYQDAAGINTANNPSIDFVAYYPIVSTTKADDASVEATYETGYQKVAHNSIDFSKTYHAIIVANANLTSSITTSNYLNDVRDMTLSDIYYGDPTRSAIQCLGFVMSSEADQTLDFGSKTPERDAAGDYYYDMTDAPVQIERMAARIDFWAVNGSYDAGKGGYVYDVTNSTDKFVVTGIMPFNLTNGHSTYGKEYLLKRLTTSLDTPVTSQWLIDETTENYVLDPMTLSKTADVRPTLANPLSTVEDLGEEAFHSSGYYHRVTSMHDAIASGGGYSSLDDMGRTGEDVVVAYPMENCLLPASDLYYHATGIAIEGYYYVGGLTDASPTRYVYYTYLRHQGEADSYDIYPSVSPGSQSTAGTAMNIGIVRNNIYRVWIDGVETTGKLQLGLAVHDWRHVEHPSIYI